MSEINDLINQVQQATEFQINKKNLREKIQTDLHMPFNGGLFKITPELFAFVKTWHDDELYIEDSYQNPIRVNRQEFVVAAQQHYQLAMNRWHNEYEQLKKIRKV